jgi:hypothetical protein
MLADYGAGAIEIEPARKGAPGRRDIAAHHPRVMDDRNRRGLTRDLKSVPGGGGTARLGIIGGGQRETDGSTFGRFPLGDATAACLAQRTLLVIASEIFPGDSRGQPADQKRR